MNDLLRQISEHLLKSGIHGLPREWWSCCFQERESPVGTGFKRALTNEDHHEVPFSQEAQEESQSLMLLREEGEKTKGSKHSDDPISQMGLLELERLARSCQKCRLCETRNKVVFGTGNTKDPQIVFVGEGPGYDEDCQGEPFVGKAGKLLTAAITQGMRLKREDVYICNVVKCRPPENRTPLVDEVAACVPYLYRQLELLQPKVIITLGSPAQMALSAVPGGISKVRGKWQTWREIRLMPTYHPAYILRYPSFKRDFWEDLKLVMYELGLEPHQVKNETQMKVENE